MRIVAPDAPRPYALASLSGPVTVVVVTSSSQSVPLRDVLSVRGYRSDGTVRFYGRRAKRLATFSVRLPGLHAQFASARVLDVRTDEDTPIPTALIDFTREAAIKAVADFAKA